MTYEQQIEHLYKENRELVKNGGTPNVEMFKRRKRALHIAIELREKKSALDKQLCMRYNNDYDNK